MNRKSVLTWMAGTALALSVLAVQAVPTEGEARCPRDLKDHLTWMEASAGRSLGIHLTVTRVPNQRRARLTVEYFESVLVLNNDEHALQYDPDFEAYGPSYSSEDVRAAAQPTTHGNSRFDPTGAHATSLLLYNYFGEFTILDWGNDDLIVLDCAEPGIMTARREQSAALTDAGTPGTGRRRGSTTTYYDLRVERRAAP